MTYAEGNITHNEVSAFRDFLDQLMNLLQTRVGNTVVVD